MNPILLGARLLLAAAFGVAGVAKVLDPAGSRQSLREFGVPAVLVPPLAILLPLCELACAAALIPAASAWWGATAALALLVLFIAAIVSNLALGRTPDCHCFGKLHSEPVGWTTVARNAALAGPAGLIVWRGPEHVGPGLVAWLASLSGSELMFLGLTLALTALAAFELVMVYQLLAQNGRIMLRIEAVESKLGGRAEPPPATGLPVDSEAPAFSLSGLDGIPVTLDALRGLGKPVLLLFSEPGCQACEELLPYAAQWQRVHGDRLLVVPIGRGDLQVNRAKSIRHGLENVLLQADREVADAFQVQGTPSAVLVKDGLIASPLAAGADAIRSLVFSATLPRSVKKGDAAPSLELRDLDGKALDVAALRGRPTVLLFWNPSCGFCRAMLPDVRAWERTRPRFAPELVVVSTGSPELSREQRFRSRVLLDQGFGAAGVFGATGTPSAVLLDENGTVASDVGVGASGVLALMGAVPVDNVVSVQ
jgi:thiol-disulfide isomerase/thioredoxin